MPPKRAAEGIKIAEECILLIGKQNNVIRWKEQMQGIVTEQYGIIGMFFSTNERFVLPKASKDYSESSSEEPTTESESDKEIPAPSEAGGGPGPFHSPSIEDAERAIERSERKAARLKSKKESRKKLRQKSRTKQREEDRSERRKELKEQRKAMETYVPGVRAGSGRK